MANDYDYDANKTLRVDYLPNSLTEKEVKSIFARIGFVTKCTLISNVDGDSLTGYAFVEYADESSVAYAIGQLDGIKIQGEKIKVTHSRGLTPSTNRSLYIAGLPQWVSEDKLHALFKPFGNIVGHTILTNQDGTSRGIGFVKFSLVTDATEAIEQMAGRVLPDSTGAITVKFALPLGSSQEPPAAVSTSPPTGGSTAINSPANAPTITHVVHPESSVAAAFAEHARGLLRLASVFVYGLKETHTELTLYELFSPYGAIIKVNLVRDAQWMCKGYGFVHYTKREYALAAIAKMNGIEFEEKKLQVKMKNPYKNP